MKFLNRRNYLKFSFVLLLISVTALNILKLGNGGIFKVVIVSFSWVSIILVLLYSLNFDIKRNRFLFISFYSLFIYNLFQILRSIFYHHQTITTLIGNNYITLSLLVPLVIFFAFNLQNIVILHKMSVIVMKLGIGITLLYLILLAIGLEVNIFSGYESISYNLLLPTIILIPCYFLYIKKIRIMILLSAILMSFVVVPDTRTVLIRFILLISYIFIVWLYFKYKKKNILHIAFLSLLIPFYFFYSGLKGESVFQDLNSKNNSEYFVDTRTFLYEEVFQSLKTKSNLYFGKGAGSKYYSEYFSDDIMIENNRFTVEVGILTILLKGGLIGVLLNLIIFFYAAFILVYKSNNIYAVGLGFLVVTHIVLLFVENLVSYNVYNFIIWFVIGMAFNKRFRQLNNFQIKNLLNEQQA